jgi:signal transduction histidine kinase
MDEVLNDLPCGFICFDDDGMILATNRTLDQMLEYDDGSLRGRRIDDILAAGGKIYYQTHFFPSLKLQGRMQEIYLKMRTRSGRTLPVLSNAVRHTSTTAAARTECVFMRMTQREQYEDEILRAKQAAEMANDARAKFVSMMSHELRTPLQSILGYAELLESETSGKLTQTQTEDVRSIKSAAEGLARLLTDILNFARVESGQTSFQLTRVRVRDAVSRAEALLRLRIEAAGLSYIQPDIPAEASVQADDYRLQQILLNVLTNALKFTSPGGEISVWCRRRDGFVLINVSDTGCGIAEQDMDKIFAPFVQLKRVSLDERSPGVGLGLAISRDLARAMRGDLTVTSQPGKGSTFTIQLPAAETVGGEAVAAA